MKNILIITNSFPPGGGSGMLRTMKFVQYLPSYGWLPVILSIHDKYNEKKDYSVLRNISDKVVVYRSVLWDPLGFFRDIGPKMPIKKSNDLRFDDCQGNKGISLRSQLIKKVKKGISNCFTTPDKFIGWLIPGLIMGFFCMRRHKIAIIYATSPAATATLIGYFLKKLTGKKLVVDFRDPWTFDRANNVEVGKMRLFIEHQMEKIVFKGADNIIVNTEYVKNLYLQKYTWFDSRKITVIPNGYDSVDFEFLDSSKQILSDELFTISHVGEFYEKDREPDNFLIAVSELIKEDKISAQKIRVNLIGGGEYVNGKKFVELLQRLNLTSVCNILPRLPHKESIRYMVQSHVLLLLQPSLRFRAQIPAKAFEYLKAGRFILAIVPESATADLMKGFEQGMVVREEDNNALKGNIFQLFKRFVEHSLNRPYCSNEAALAKFERKALTFNLSNILDALISTPK